jgi:hypothetical protein
MAPTVAEDSDYKDFAAVFNAIIQVASEYFLVSADTVIRS